MRKNNTAIIFGSLFFSCSVMAANGTLAPTVVPMVNGGQASIAISNTSPNLFTVPGDRIIAVNSLDGALTNNEQTASGGVVVKGHVSFRGKNGIKGEVVMRNGKILGWAWGAGFVDGIGQGMERASQPAVGLGATAAYGAGDVLKMGIGGGASKAAQTLSDYYIKRAEQYHPVIPIGAGNEVTVVFQDGFQLKTVEEMALERTQSRAEEENQESPVPVPPSAESHLNGFNTDQMLKQLGNLNPQQFMSGSQGGGNDGK